MSGLQASPPGGLAPQGGLDGGRKGSRRIEGEAAAEGAVAPAPGYDTAFDGRGRRHSRQLR
jgi:hypothetical protein